MKDMNALRRNLRAVNETRQITNAMFLLSTSRMKRALQRVEYNKTYARRIRSAVKDILAHSPEYLSHDFLTRRSTGATAWLVITSDKGLCGAYNYNAVNEAVRGLSSGGEALLEVVGLSGEELLREKGFEPDVEWFVPSMDTPLFYARQIGEHLAEMYERGYIDEVRVVFTDYESPMRQAVRTVRLLPLRPEDFQDVEPEYSYTEKMLYEPSVEQVFHNLLVQYAVSMVYEMLNLSFASEHCVRRNAMQSATDNADGMVKNLTMQCNQARQLAITNEITEIAAATEIISKAI